MMWRHLGLPVCALLACLESAPSLAAGTPEAPRFEAANQWPSQVPLRLIPLRPAHATAAGTRLSQAEPPPAGRASTEPARAAIPDAALKAEADKRWPEAEQSFRDLLAKEPERVDLLVHLANILAAQGKALPAAQTMARAADLRPGDADLQVNASEGFGAADRPLDATRYNERALALRPTDEALLLRRARLAIWTGDNALAVETLRRLVQSKPADLTLKRDLGRVLGWQGQPEEGARLLSEYVAQHGDDKDALLDLARLEATLGHDERAADLMRRYREAGGDPQTVSRDIAQGRLQAAMKAESERRLADAEQIYRRMLAAEPERADLLIRLSDVLAAEGKNREAAETVGKAADLRRSDADLQLRASRGFASVDSAAEAIRYNDRALALRPNDKELLRRRVGLDVWAGDMARAAATLKALIATYPDDPALQRELKEFQDRMLLQARNLLEQGNKEQAFDRLEQYRTTGGDQAIYERERARVEEDADAPRRAEIAQRPAEAERLYRERLAKEPNRADLLRRLSDVLAAQGKNAEAAQTLAKAADLEPNDVQLQIRMSEAYASLGRPADALRHLDRALQVDPENQDLHARRAKIAAWAGKYAEAAESLRKLLRANPSDLTLKRDLGRVLSWLGRFNEAAPLLSEYLTQYPEDKDTLLELARIEAMRGNRKSALELLERYRAAGGDDATYRREQELLRPAAKKPRAAVPQQPATAPAAGGLPPGIPAAGVVAEARKRLPEAARIYRNALAQNPANAALWQRLSTILAAEGKRREAAEALSHAADLRPLDVELQLRTSEGFAFADQPMEALRYTNRALAQRPNDLDLHRRRAKLAGWAGVNQEAEESLRAILAADPNDLPAKRDLGQVVGWQGRADEAVRLLSEYVPQRPDDQDAWLALARNQAGRGNFDPALAALRRYREIGGNPTTYRRDLATFLAWAGRSRAALEQADAGLTADPSDFQLGLARAIALKNGFEYGAAAAEADRLAQLRPGAVELPGLRRSIEVLQRPYLQLDTNLYRESDDVSWLASELSFYQPVDDGWWVAAGGGGTFLDARSGSLGAPIQGGTSIGRGWGWVGAQARLDFGTIAAARLGATATSRGSTEPIWQVTLDRQWSDEFRLQVLNLRDLQAVSPRSVSLDIMRIDTEAQLTYTPDLLWTFVGAAREAELSDGNRFLRGYLSPRRAVLRSQDWKIDLGISGNISSYREYPLQNGYYAPSFYQQYLASTYVYYKLSDEDGISLVGSLGAHKDETMNSFRLTTGIAAEATFGAFSDWMAKVRAGYSNSGSAGGPNFSAESVGFTLIRRF